MPASAIRAQEAGTAEGKCAAVGLPNLAPSVDRVRADEARDARIDAEVTDVASFVKWAKAAREEKIQSLYKRRETIRSEKGSSRFKRERIESDE